MQLYELPDPPAQTELESPPQASQDGDTQPTASAAEILVGYRLWKRYVPFLYDHVSTHVRDWPSLTVQWLPDNDDLDSGDGGWPHLLSGDSNSYTNHALLLGANANSDPTSLLDGNSNEGGAAVATGLSGSSVSIAHVRLPVGEEDEVAENISRTEDWECHDEDAQEKLALPPLMYSCTVHTRLRFETEYGVARARAMPQRATIIACKTGGPAVDVFDATQHPNFASQYLGEAPNENNDNITHKRKKQKRGGGKSVRIEPTAVLVGHEKDGYALAWSPHDRGRLASGSDGDGLVCVWDLACGGGSHLTSGGNTSANDSDGIRQGQISPQHILHNSSKVSIGDVKWHPRNAKILGTVDDDSRLQLWDLRDSTSSNSTSTSTSTSATSAYTSSSSVSSTSSRCATQSIIAHEGAPIHALAFMPSRPQYLITASSDHTLKLWDIRKLSREVHTFVGHRNEVFQITWNPHCPNVFASCGADRRVLVWDINNITDDKTDTGNGSVDTADDADGDDSPPELLFVHGGHTDKVFDVAWNPSVGNKWTLASAAEDNIVQVWSPSPAVSGYANTNSSGSNLLATEEEEQTVE